jgi:hypothetical protein
MASSFVSRTNDLEGYWAPGVLYRLARERGTLELSFVLAADERIVAVETLDAVTRSFKDVLAFQLERRHVPTTWLVSAELRVQFESGASMPSYLGLYAGCKPFTCSATLIDDRGRKHEASASSWCWPHDPKREARRAGFEALPADR